jgi:hypothetical protein
MTMPPTKHTKEAASPGAARPVVSGTEPGLPRVSDGATLARYLEKRVILVGTPAALPRQHLMGHYMNYPFTACIDLPDGTQVGVYVKSHIQEKIAVEITGRVVAVLAPGSASTNVVGVAYQIVAEHWRYSP